MKSAQFDEYIPRDYAPKYPGKDEVQARPYGYDPVTHIIGFDRVADTSVPTHRKRQLCQRAQDPGHHVFLEHWFLPRLGVDRPGKMPILFLSSKAAGHGGLFVAPQTANDASIARLKLDAAGGAVAKPMSFWRVDRPMPEPKTPPCCIRWMSGD